MDNSELNTVEMGFKALTLFGVSVYPRVSDMARLAQDKTIFLATAMRYQYFGTKELRSVKVFTQQSGTSRDQCTQVCPVLALKDYIDRTSGQLYRPADLVYKFQHVFMSQVPDRSTGFHFPVGDTDLLSMDATNYGSYQGRP